MPTNDEEKKDEKKAESVPAPDPSPWVIQMLLWAVKGTGKSPSVVSLLVLLGLGFSYWQDNDYDMYLQDRVVSLEQRVLDLETEAVRRGWDTRVSNPPAPPVHRVPSFMAPMTSTSTEVETAIPPLVVHGDPDATPVVEPTEPAPAEPTPSEPAQESAGG